MRRGEVERTLNEICGRSWGRRIGNAVESTAQSHVGRKSNVKPEKEEAAKLELNKFSLVPMAGKCCSVEFSWVSSQILVHEQFFWGNSKLN